MLKVYCQNCGSPTEYSLTPPIFCAQCAKPLKSLSGAVTQASNTIKKSKVSRLRAPAPAQTDDDDDYDGPEVNTVPQLDKLDVDLDFSDSSSFKIGQIAASAKVNPIDTKADIPTKEQILNNFKKQASSLAGQDSSEVS